jgi:hypothetical protein
MYKGRTRDTQGTNRLAIPEQYRSNTLAPGLPHARSSASAPSRQIRPTRPVQGRNPKTEGREKAEIRSPESIAIAAEWQPIGSGHSRISGFGLLSVFELRPSDFRAAGLGRPSTSRTLEQPCRPALACDLLRLRMCGIHLGVILANTTGRRGRGVVGAPVSMPFVSSLRAAKYG